MERKDYEQMLNEKVKLKIAGVGIGFAGSYNAQRCFNDIGIDTFVINSSTKDLSNQIISKEIPSFIIGKDGRGAGNDREKALEMFKYNGRQLIEDNATYVEMVADSDIVFVFFGSGGGTGSGSGPSFVKINKKFYPKKLFIPVVIAPKSSDSPLAHYNNLECINELDELDCPYIIADLDRFANEDDNVAYEKMSDWVVETVRAIGGFTLDLSESGMMDENDLQTTISADGYLAQYTVEVNAKSIDKMDIQDQLLQRIANSPAMAIQKDGNVTWGGIIINLPEDVSDPIRTGDLSKITKVAGLPKHIFKNYSVSKSTKGSVTLILSGLSIPYNRLTESSDKVKEYLKAKKASEREISLQDDLAALRSMNPMKVTPGKDEVAAAKAEVDDFFK